MFDLRRHYEVDVIASFIDDTGEPAQVENPVWTSSDSEDVAIVMTGNPLAVTLQALGPVGDVVNIMLQADADLGEGVAPIEIAEDVRIISGQAAGAVFGFSEPRPIQTP